MTHNVSAAAVVLAVILCAGCVPSAAPRAERDRQSTVPNEKDSRTPAQKKIDSQLLYEIYRLQGLAAQKGVPPGDTGVRIDDKKRALVDVRAAVTPALSDQIKKLDGTIVSSSPLYSSTIAWIPLLKLEQLADGPAVRAIQPAAEATTH